MPASASSTRMLSQNGGKETAVDISQAATAKPGDNLASSRRKRRRKTAPEVSPGAMETFFLPHLIIFIKGTSTRPSASANHPNPTASNNTAEPPASAPLHTPQQASTFEFTEPGPKMEQIANRTAIHHCQELQKIIDSFNEWVLLTLRSANDLPNHFSVPITPKGLVKHDCYSFYNALNKALDNRNEARQQEEKLMERFIDLVRARTDQIKSNYEARKAAVRRSQE